MSVLAELESTLNLNAAVLFSIMALVVALVGVGLCSLLYYFLVPFDKYTALVSPHTQ